MTIASTHAGGTRSDNIPSGDNLIGRIVALVGGVILLIAGVALGVTIVLLPVGVPVAILGLVLCVAAVGLGRSGRKRS